MEDEILKVTGGQDLFTKPLRIGDIIPTSNLFLNIFHFNYKESNEKNHFITSFIIKFESKKYLITAKHIFSAFINSGSIVEFNLFLYNKWIKIEKKVFFHNNKNIDIAIIPLDYEISTHYCILGNIGNNELQGLATGQDVYFYGFPFNLSCNYSENINSSSWPNDNHFPFIKRGIISGSGNEGNIIYIDGINNHGFSGGPVIFKNYYDNEWHIMGIISGYLADTTEKIETKWGEEYEIELNSGLLKCYAINYVPEIIKTI
jgi:hypothetical protein